MSKKSNASIGSAGGASTPKSVKADGFCAYIGPTIMGVIQSGTIYRGTKEKVVASLSNTIKKYPLIEPLIVTGGSLPDAKNKVKTPGNYLFVQYNKLVSEKTRR